MTDFSCFEPQDSQKNIRIKARHARQNLSPEFRALASAKICEELIFQAQVQEAQNIGVYLALPEEVSLQKFITWCFAHKKQVYAPRVKNSALEFVLMTPKTVIKKGTFGVQEPESLDPSEIISPHDLDIILVPLVAFDEKLNRIGMGGGFYDRAFEALNKNNSRAQEFLFSVLVGCAFECQKIDQIIPNAWDVKLDQVVTECRQYFFE